MVTFYTVCMPHSSFVFTIHIQFFLDITKINVYFINIMYGEYWIICVYYIQFWIFIIAHCTQIIWILYSKFMIFNASNNNMQMSNYQYRLVVYGCNWCVILWLLLLNVDWAMREIIQCDTVVDIVMVILLCLIMMLNCINFVKNIIDMTIRLLMYKDSNM